MMDANVLLNGGIDSEKGVARFMGDRELYESVLIAFLDDETFNGAEAAFRAKDYKALFMHIHTLKGASGTLDMTDLYKASCELTDLIRDVQSPDEAAVQEGFDKVRRLYHRACRAVEQAKEG